MSFTLTAQLKLQNPNNIQQVVNQLRKAVGDVDVKVRINNAGQLTNLNNTLTSVSKNAKQATSSITNFGEQAALAAKRFFAFSVATNGFLKLIGAIQRGVNDAIEFEKEVYKIAQVTGNAVRDLKDLSDEVTKLSTSLGVSSNKILNAAQILAQAGLSAEDTKKALDALAKTELSATFDDIVNTTEGAVAIFAQFGIKADQLEGKLGSINAVAGKFAVESSDLVTAVRRTGGAFQAAGGSLEELIALFTSVRATTRESAESIATGFRTIFTRLQRVRTVNFLSDLGIQLRDMEGQFIGPYEAVRKLSEALNSIPSTDPRFAQIIEELGGFRQVSKVIPLIQKFSEAEKALVVAQQGQSSLARDAAQAQGSLANQLAKVGEQFDALIRKISNNDSFKAMVKIVTELASAFIKVADAAVPLLPLVTLMATRKVGQIAPQFFGGFLAKKGLGFAKGGLVPGSGNSDSVSANLTPGEYVLKKKAVETIGVDRLHAMNSGRKYAKGGRIEDLTDAELDAMHSEIVSAGGGRGVKVSASSRLNARAAAGKYINPLLYQNINPLLSATSPSEIRSLKLKTSSENVQARQDKKAATELQNTNNEAIAVSAGLSKVARTFGAIYLRPRDKKGEYNTSISGVLRTGSGEVPADIPIFYKEATMTSASAKSFEKKFDAMLPDVVSNLAGTISRNFGSKVLKSTPTKLNSIPGKQSVMGWLFEGALASLGAPYLEDADDSRNFDFPGGLGNLSNVFPISEIKGRPVDAKLTQTQDARDSLRNKAKTYLATTYPRIFRFASGGMAEGTDTVPAMVTPGEYIFSKEAAQRIGYHNLDRLNRVQKFRHGGAVRKFASGSRVPVGNPFASSKSNIPLANSDPSTKALVFATTMQLVGQQLSGFGSEIDKLTSVITGAGTQFAIMRSVVKDMNPNFGFFNKALEENSQKLIDISQTKKPRLELATKRAKRSAERDFLDPFFGSDPVAAERAKSQFVIKETKRARIAERNKIRQDRLAALKQQSILKGRAAFAETGLFAASAAGSIAGGFLQDRGDAAIRAGSTDRTQSTLGGLAQGAAIGASVGAIFGPVGIAVGAFGGAVIGTTTAFINAGKQIESVKFDKVMKNFQRDLEDGLSLDELNEFGREAANRLDTSTGDDFTTSLGQIEQTAVSVDSKFKDLLKSFADGSDDIDQIIARFNKAVDPRTIYAFQIATSRNAKEFGEYLKKAAQSADSSSKQAIKVESAMSRLAQTTIELNNAMAGLDFTEQKFAESRSRVSTITSDRFQLQPSRAEAFSKNPLAFTSSNQFVGSFIDNNVRNEIREIGKLLPTQFQQRFTDSGGLIDKGAESISKIRGAVLQVKGGGGSLDDAGQKIIDALGTNAPKEIEAAVTATLKGIVTEEAKSQKINAESAEDLISKLTDSIKGASGIDALGRMAQITSQKLADLNNILSEINNLEKANRDLTLSGIDVQEQFQSDLANLFPASQNIGDFDKTRQRNITGLLQTNNPQQLGTGLRFAQDRLVKEQQKGLLADPAIIKNTESEMQRFSDGLKYLADYSKRAAGPLREISLIRAKRQEASGALDRTFGGGAGSVREEFKRRFAGEQILQGKSGTLSPQLITEGIASLEQNKLSIVEALGGGKAGEDEFNKRIAAARETQGKLLQSLFGGIGGTTQKALGIQTAAAGAPSLTEEQKQTKALEDIQGLSQKALEELRKFNQQKIDQLQQQQGQVNQAAAQGAVKTQQLQVETDNAKLAELKAQQQKLQDDRQKFEEFGRLTGVTGGTQVERDKKIQENLERFKGIDDYKTREDLMKDASRYKKAATEFDRIDALEQFNKSDDLVDAFKRSNMTDKEFLESTEFSNRFSGKDINPNNEFDKISATMSARRQFLTRRGRESIEEANKVQEGKFTPQELKNRDEIIKARNAATASGSQPSDVSNNLASLQTQIDKQAEAVKNSEKALADATATLKSITEALSKIPQDIALNGNVNVNANVNGVEAMSTMQKGIASMISVAISNALQAFNVANGNNLKVPDIVPKAPWEE